MKKIGFLISLILVFILCSCGGTEVQEKNKYTITWEVNGKIVEADNDVVEGTIPTYDGATPTKETDEDYVYTFSGWSPEIYPADKDQKYVAEFSSTPVVKNKYTITWEVNGKIVETDNDVAEGTVPTYDGATPTKETDEDYVYTFSGWSPEIYPADKDQKYVAEFSSTPKYLITLEKVKEELKNLYESQSYSTGSVNLITTSSIASDVTIEYEVDSNLATLTDNVLNIKALDDENSFILTANLTLDGHTDSIDLNIVTKNIYYTVSFDTDGGSGIDSVKVLAGFPLEKVEEPKKEGYVFVGWLLNGDIYDLATPITKDITLVASYNESLPIKDYLNTLLTSYEFNPWSYIPETLQPGYDLVSKDLSYDFTNFVNVEDIIYGGFGEQWNMVVTNLNQSETFFKVLSTLDAVVGASITAFNNYIDSNPANANEFSYKYGTYDVFINYADNVLSYVLSFTADIPVLGEQTAEVMLALDVTTGTKTGRIQLGDANAIRYDVTENSYSFGIKYLGARRAYFTISKDELNNVEGHIYEYLEAGSVGTLTSSCADFYIDSENERLGVVGNKASGLLGFTGNIYELYDISSGKLIGYEVEETDKFVGAVSFDTLWFNLADVIGIHNIKAIEGSTDDNKSNSYTIYVNDSSKQLLPKKVGGIGLDMRSRRYDIEMRTQYFYAYDKDSEEYIEIEVNIPMLFVQEEYYEDLVDDFASENDITISLNNNITDNVSYLEENYHSLVPIFEENKENVPSEEIIEYIGEKFFS